MSNQLPDYYEILQVSENAEPEAIQATYRRLSRKYHPDHNDSPEAAERMIDLNLAFEILGNPEKRATYDRERKSKQENERSERYREPSRPNPPPPRPPADQDSPSNKPSQKSKGSPSLILWGVMGAMVAALSVAVIILIGRSSSEVPSETSVPATPTQEESVTESPPTDEAVSQEQVTFNAISAINSIQSYKMVRQNEFEATQIRYVHPDKLHRRITMEANSASATVFHIDEPYSPADSFYSDNILAEGQSCIRHGIVASEAQDIWDCSTIGDDKAWPLETNDPSRLLRIIQDLPRTDSIEILDSGYRRDEMESHSCYLFWKEELVTSGAQNIETPITMTSEICLGLETFLPLLVVYTSEGTFDDGKPYFHTETWEYSDINESMEINPPSATGIPSDTASTPQYLVAYDLEKLQPQSRWDTYKLKIGFQNPSNNLTITPLIDASNAQVETSSGGKFTAIPQRISDFSSGYKPSEAYTYQETSIWAGCNNDSEILMFPSTLMLDRLCFLANDNLLTREFWEISFTVPEGSQPTRLLVSDAIEFDLTNLPTYETLQPPVVTDPQNTPLRTGLLSDNVEASLNNPRIIGNNDNNKRVLVVDLTLENTDLIEQFTFRVAYSVMAVDPYGTLFRSMGNCSDIETSLPFPAVVGPGEVVTGAVCAELEPPNLAEKMTEWISVEVLIPEELGLDPDGIMNIRGAAGTMEQFRTGILAPDGTRIVWVGNKRLGRVEVFKERTLITAEREEFKKLGENYFITVWAQGNGFGESFNLE